MATKLIVFVVLLFLAHASMMTGLSGPGLQPDMVVMPARHFLVNISNLFTRSEKNIDQKLLVEVSGKSEATSQCRIWVNKLNRKDGTFIARYKLYESCYDLSINVLFEGNHLKGSPMKFKGPILSDDCICPQQLDKWLSDYGCPQQYSQIDEDLKPFQNVDMNKYLARIIQKYHHPESNSFCHYVIKSNEVYRKCYGKHVGFNMFSDNILLSLTRKAVLPDSEFFMNLGDWPLIKKDIKEVLPMFSWCGSDETIDIVLPTYDITESTLENMGRVSLDMLSVQGSTDLPWEKRESRAFWRGRDSRLERLKMIDIAREHPHLFNASLTNFFFYRDKEAKYGPKQPHISFYKFFDYKYQINIDGTVAAYRLPYLLAGGSLVLKQSSPYYEHFYKSLVPWEHYVPVARDLSDLVEKVQWAQNNDEKAKQIAKNAHDFVQKHLLPQNIFCYHAVLLKEWSQRLKNVVKIHDDMTHVPQTGRVCNCGDRTSTNKDEL